MSPRVLVVDDDPSFRSLVAALLRDQADVVEAGSGRAATRALGAGQFDALVVDGLLPDTTGMKWIRAAREAGCVAPVLFVSSYWRDLASYKLLTEELGVSQVVHKPISPPVFAEQLSGLLRQGASDEDEPPRSEDPIAALRRTFAAALPDRVAELSTAVRRAAQAPADAEPKERAAALAHRLRGSAGSYGFHDIGRLAGEIEATLAAPRPPAAPLEPTLRRMEQLATYQPATLRQPPSSREPEPLPRVLFASSDPAARQLAMAATSALFRVDVARTPEEALDLAGRAAPDVAVLDLDDRGAATLAAALRGRRGQELLPLAFVGQGDGLAARIDATHAGASWYLPKPVPADAFVSGVRHLVTARHAARPRVAVLDDDDDFTSAVAAILRGAGLVPVVLADPTGLLDVLAAGADLLLLDATLPTFSGFDVCRMLRATPALADLPIVFVTARTDLDSRLAAFEAGADDYLAKPVVLAELLARTVPRIERARFARDRASKDSLTGLLRRGAFTDQLAGLVSRARRSGESLTVALLDLDHFKQLNDRHGHAAGDRVLEALGAMISQRFRAEDLRSRWGGEEFAIAFFGEAAATVEGALSRLLEELSAREFDSAARAPFHVTFSAGVAATPHDGTTAEELLACADQRLYAAKRAGRARVVASG